MDMIKYKAQYSTIEKVEIVRETDKQVVIAVDWGRKSEHREAKFGVNTSYFDTFDEAQQWLVDKAQLKVDNLKLQIHYAESELGISESLKEQ